MNAKARSLIILGVLTCLLTPGHLAAAPFSVEIVVDDEDDIEELYRDGEIDEDARDRLLTLLLTRIDLNLATRDELYELPAVTYTLADTMLAHRAAKGRFFRVDDLLGVKGMTPAIMKQVRAFVTVRSKDEEEGSVSSKVKLGAIYHTKGDGPAFFTQTKVRFMGHGRVGALLAVRPMIGLVNHAAPAVNHRCKGGTCDSVLSASRTALRFDPAGLYLAWDGSRVAAIAGSFRVGYGLGLTIDNSTRRQPHGWYPNVDYSEDVESGNMRPFEGFVGAAVRIKQVDLGPGWVDATVFGSFWMRDLFLYDLTYNKRDGDPFIVDEDLSEVTYKDSKGDPVTEVENDSLHFEYPTLPYIMRELLGGGNVTYWINRRSYVGVTGYGASWKMMADAENFRPSAFGSKYPFDRTTWGTIGANTKFGFGRMDFAAELAFTDRGDPGLLVKAWLNPAVDLEVIPSFRYYSAGFDTPYNRGESNGDEHLGNRARDELGGRLRVNYRPFKMLRLRLDLDVWHHRFPGARSSDLRKNDLNTYTITQEQLEAYLKNSKEDPATDLETTFRAQLRPTSKERVTLQLTYHDEALDRGGRDLSYEIPSGTKADLWGGVRIRLRAQVTTKRIPRTIVAASFIQIFEDSHQFTDKFERHWAAWLKVTAVLNPGPRVALRVKYEDEYNVDLPTRGSRLCSDEERGTPDSASSFPGICRGESFVEAYLQASQKITWLPMAGSFARLRFGWYHFTDKRSRWAGPTAYDPNPKRDQFVIKGQLMAKF